MKICLVCSTTKLNFLSKIKCPAGCSRNGVDFLLWKMEKAYAKDIHRICTKTWNIVVIIIIINCSVTSCNIVTIIFRRNIKMTSSVIHMSMYMRKRSAVKAISTWLHQRLLTPQLIRSPFFLSSSSRSSCSLAFNRRAAMLELRLSRSGAGPGPPVGGTELPGGAMAVAVAAANSAAACW